MRILHVAIAYYPATGYGGPIRSIRNLCAGLADLGHDCTVCVTNSDGTKQINVPCGMPQTVDRATVYYFKSPRWNYYGYSPRMKRWLKRHVTDYDLVHISGIWSFPERYAAVAARKAGVPYVVSPRGSADRRLVRHYLPKTKWLYVNVVDRQNLSTAAAIHYTTVPELENSMLRHMCRKHFVVPNATTFGSSSDGSVASNTKVDVIVSGGSDPYVLFVGRLNWKKQIDVLIRAFARLRSAHKDLRLVIAGPDDDGLGARLRSLVRELEIDDHVDFLGSVEGNALLDLFRNARLFVLPSLSENFGHSAVEALAMGVPAVLSKNIDVVAFPEIADIAEVCAPDEDGVLSACQHVLDNLDRAEARVRSGREVVNRLFSIPSVCCRMADEYQKVIGRT